MSHDDQIQKALVDAREILPGSAIAVLYQGRAARCLGTWGLAGPTQAAIVINGETRERQVQTAELELLPALALDLEQLKLAVAKGFVDPDFAAAVIARADAWVPANGGKETAYFDRSRGCRVLYCYNPAEGRHAYVDVDSDIVLED